MGDFCRIFLEIRSTIVDISNRQVIDYFVNGLKDKFLYQYFIWHRPRMIAEFHNMIENWIDVDERSLEKFGDKNTQSNDRNSDQRKHDRLTGKKQGLDNTVVAMSKEKKGGVSLSMIYSKNNALITCITNIHLRNANNSAIQASLQK